MKISVIGMGKVGAATAFSLVIRAIPHELVLVARTKEKALGDALDLQHAAAMVRSMEVIAGDAAELGAWDAESLETTGVETADDGLLGDLADFGGFAGGIDFSNVGLIVGHGMLHRLGPGTG